MQSIKYPCIPLRPPSMPPSPGLRVSLSGPVVMGILPWKFEVLGIERS